MALVNMIVEHSRSINRVLETLEPKSNLVASLDIEEVAELYGPMSRSLHDSTRSSLEVFRESTRTTQK